MRPIDADKLLELLNEWKRDAVKRGAVINNVFASVIILMVETMPTMPTIKEHKLEWTPVAKRLPEEPADGLKDMDDLAEYNVMIEGAAIPTTLYYAGSGQWYRDGEFYKVIAWQPLPEPWKAKD